LLRHLDQETVKRPFRFSSQAATCSGLELSIGNRWRYSLLFFYRISIYLYFFTIDFQPCTCYYQSIHSKVEAIPLSALPKDKTSELAGLFSHYPSFMLNVKQGNCKYQLLKSFGLTWPGNRTQVY